MQRGERNEAGEFSDDLGVDPHRPLVDRTAMNDAMPRRDQTVLRETMFKPAQQRGKRILVRRTLRQVLVKERRSGAVFRGEMYAVADPRALTLADEILPRRSLLAGKERELDAR